MGGKRNTCFFGNRDDLIQEFGKSLPEHFMCDGWFVSRRCISVVNHVPSHATRHRRVKWGVHSDRERTATSKRSFYSAAYAGDAEVVTDDRNAGLADAA